jgi:hypothetical protein
LLGFARNLFHRRTASPGFAFSRPLVILESDDWGRVGVRDREGYDQLRAGGLRIGEHPYDLYTLETADDVTALASLLARHQDSTHRPPCLVMNFCTFNLDFKKMRARGFKTLELLALAQGLPGGWSRPGLLESYRSGIAQGVFHPALHGATHFCPMAVENATAISDAGTRYRFLRLLWEADTPYIHWRMPWIGYEYWNPEKPHAGFIPAERQRLMVKQACEGFAALFGAAPTSACAPGYRSNQDTHRAWSEAGVHVAQNGTGSGLRPPRMDGLGLLHLYRTVDFEPSHKELDKEKYLQIATSCFARGLPLVISVHSINFHSTLKDFRTATLAALDELLTALETRYPDLLYVNHEDIYSMVTEGRCRSSSHGDRGSVAVSQLNWKSRATQAGAY